MSLKILRMIMGIRLATGLALIATILGGSGCGSTVGGHTQAEVAQYNKQRNISPDKVKSFLSQLAAVAPAQRRDFVNAHPDDMRALGQDQDPADQERFQRIVRGLK